jgi:hypothetical protein
MENVKRELAEKAREIYLLHGQPEDKDRDWYMGEKWHDLIAQDIRDRQEKRYKEARRNET